MKPYNTDKLYLLEIMVSRLVIDYDKLGLDDETIESLKQIVIMCKFQNLPEIQIFEDEFSQDRESYPKVSKVVLQTGKSCLFSARGIREDLEFFTLRVEVAREKAGGGCLVLGSTCVRLDSRFVDVLRSDRGQDTKSLEEKYPMYSKNYCCAGTISLCVRLSSLGKMILTSLQGGDQGSEPYILKGEATVDPGGPPEGGDWGRLLGGADLPKGYGGPPFQPPFIQQPLPPPPPMLGGDRRPRRGEQGAPPFCGHLTIGSSSSSEESEPPPPPPPFPPGTFCSCDYPLPPGFDQPPPPPPKKKKKPRTPCPLELRGEYCVRPDCPMGLRQLPTIPQSKKKEEECDLVDMDPGAIGLADNQMMFQYPQQPPHQQQYQYYGGQQDLVRPGPNTFTLQDDKNDIYILKIGSKHDANKPKFILELKTPKLKTVDIKTQEATTQYREEDFTPPAPPKAAKKGKKGKKGKGKKGKKGGKGKKGKKGKGKGKGKKKGKK